MTPKEHFFILLVFTRLNSKVNVLQEALKASGAVLPDDLEAYQSYTLAETPERMQLWLKQTWAAYQATAASLGITTGLEHGPSLPRK
jgi:hypothetical protein